MLLAVNRLGYKKSVDKMYVWDTDDMVVEEINRVYAWSKHAEGTIHIDNLSKVAVHLDVDGLYTVSNILLMPCEKPVMLGCGDIWYDKYVYNAFSGCMFEIEDTIREVMISGTYYAFSYEWLGGDVREATFLFLPTHGMYSNANGKSGLKMSREEFLKRASLGVL